MARLSLAVLLTAKNSASGPLKEAQGQIVTLGNAATGAAGKIGGLVTGLGKIGLAGMGLKTLATGLSGFTKGLISGNAEMETYVTQFGVLMKSTDKAQERLKELAEFGAKTPFELPELARADKVLLAFGLTSEDAAKRFKVSGKQIRTTIGDVAAGTGSGFEEIAKTFGRFASGATGEAIQRFQELGIVTREEMAGIGIEFSKSGQMLTPAAEAFTKLEAHLRQKFGGMMEAQSSTFEGMLANLSDWWEEAKRTLMAPLFDSVKAQTAELVDFLNSPEVEQGIQGMAKGLGEGIAKAGDLIGNVGGKVKDFVGFLRGTAGFDVMRAWFGADIGPRLDEVTRGIQGIVAAGWQLGNALGQAVSGEISWDGLLTQVDWAKDRIGESLGKIGTQLGDVLGRLGETIGTELGKVDWEATAAAIGTGINNALTAASDFAEKVAAPIRNAVASIDWGSVWESATGIGEGLAQRLGSIDWTATGQQLGAGLRGILPAVFELAFGGEEGGEASTGLTGMIGKMFAGIDWAKLGREAVPYVARNVAGFAVGFISALLDPGVWLTFFGKHWQELIAIIVSIFLAPAKLLAPFKTALARIPIAGEFLSWLVGGISNAGKSARGALEAAMKDPAEGLLRGLMTPLRGPNGILGRLRGVFSDVNAGIVAWGQQMATHGSTQMFNFGQAITRGTIHVFSAIGHMLSKVLEMLLNGRVKAVSAALAFGSGIITGIRSGLASISIPLPSISLVWETVAEAFGQAISLPRLNLGVVWHTLASLIPGLAKGGRITNEGLVLVGERGPEVLNLPQGASVEPLGRGGKGGALNVFLSSYEGEADGLPGKLGQLFDQALLAIRNWSDNVTQQLADTFREIREGFRELFARTGETVGSGMRGLAEQMQGSDSLRIAQQSVETQSGAVLETVEENLSEAEQARRKAAETWSNAMAALQQSENRASAAHNIWMKAVAEFGAEDAAAIKAHEVWRQAVGQQMQASTDVNKLAEDAWRQALMEYKAADKAAVDAYSLWRQAVEQFGEEDANTRTAFETFQQAVEALNAAGAGTNEAYANLKQVIERAASTPGEVSEAGIANWQEAVKRFESSNEFVAEAGEMWRQMLEQDGQNSDAAFDIWMEAVKRRIEHSEGMAVDASIVLQEAMTGASIATRRSAETLKEAAAEADIATTQAAAVVDAAIGEESERRVDTGTQAVTGMLTELNAEVEAGIPVVEETGKRYGAALMNAIREGLASVEVPLPDIGISWKDIAAANGQIVQVPHVGLGVKWHTLRDLIPALASGGYITRSGYALVGERGPELLSLNRGAEVRPLEREQPLVVNVYVSGSVTTEADLVETIRRGLLADGRRNVTAGVW